MSLAEPVSLLDKLVSCPEPDARAKAWPDYLERLALTEADIPELIAIATNESLTYIGTDTAWAPLHAWRCLGQLRAIAAAEPLLPLFGWDWDWAWEDLPEAYALIGPDALPILEAAIVPFLRDDQSGVVSMVSVIAKIGAVSDVARTAAVATLGRLLLHYKTTQRIINGALTSAAIDLKAVEHAELLATMHAADRVDTSYCGSWAQVQVDLGLRDRSEFQEADLKPLYKDLAPFQQYFQERGRLAKAPDQFFTAAQPQRPSASGFGKTAKFDATAAPKSEKKRKKR
jgi:hypothetical protein